MHPTFLGVGHKSHMTGDSELRRSLPLWINAFGNKMLVSAILALLVGSSVAQSDNTTTTTPPAINVTTPTPVVTTRMPTAKPAPEYTKGTFFLNHTNSNETCINVTMAVQITVEYDNTDNAKETAMIVLPQVDQVTVSGFCAQPDENLTQRTSNITLSWENGHFFLTLLFQEDFQQNVATTQPPTTSAPTTPTTNSTSEPTENATSEVPVESMGRRRLLSVQDNEGNRQFVSEISFTYNTASDYFVDPNEESVFTVTTEDSLFEGESGKAYKCNSQTDFEISDDVNANFKDVMFQPFYESDQTLEEFECSADQTSSDDNKKWIIIGVCVGGGVALLLIILIIIGCTMSKRKGYKPV